MDRYRGFVEPLGMLLVRILGQRLLGLHLKVTSRGAVF
jgi:hypothetical protein